MSPALSAAVMLAALLAVHGLGGLAFTQPMPLSLERTTLRRSAMVQPSSGGEENYYGPSWQTSMAAGVAGGLLASSLCARRGSRSVVGKTTSKYTTQVILPSLAWIKSGLKLSDVSQTELQCCCLEGVDVLLGKTAAGKLFAVADKCPPTGTSLSIGGEVEGNLVVDGQYGSAFDVFTGYPERWCPTPPGIGGFIGWVMGGEQALQTFEVRTAPFTSDIEVLIDINTRRAYEADYWKGLLDAQGKDDGTFY